MRELRLKRVLNQWIPSSATLRVVVHARDGSDGRPCWGPELDLLKQRFREATDGAATDAKNAGVPIVFCTLPRNIHTNPPAHSVLSEALRSNPIEMERWRSFIGFAKDAMTQRKDGAAALEFLHRAAKIDDAPAELHFEIARALEMTGDADAARAEYRRALELDGCPMRALAWVESTVREVAAARGAPLLDLEKVFDAAGSLGIAGEELICDNVHPNLRGHEVIADELLGVFERDLHLPLERRRDVSLEDGRRRLGLDISREDGRAQVRVPQQLSTRPEANKVDDWWTKTVEQCKTVLQYNPSDFEVSAALGCLRTLGGDAKTGKELLEKALASDGYVQTSYVYYYKTQAPYRRLLELAGIDMAAEERKLTSGQRMQLEHRLTRAGRCRWIQPRPRRAPRRRTTDGGGGRIRRAPAHPGPRDRHRRMCGKRRRRGNPAHAGDDRRVAPEPAVDSLVFGSSGRSSPRSTR